MMPKESIERKGIYQKCQWSTLVRAAAELTEEDLETHDENHPLTSEAETQPPYLEAENQPLATGAAG